MSEMPIHDLFDRHHLRLFRYFVRLGEPREAAEDLTQEVFLRALRGADGYRALGREEAWLFRIARNLWTDRLRRARRTPSSTVVDLAVAAPQPLRAGLDEALAELDVGEREVFLLREIGGLSYDEIAAICAISHAAVRSRLFRARRDLRRRLRPAMPEPKGATR